MADDDQNLLPERILLNMLDAGVAAITANPTIIDRFIGVNLEDTDEQDAIRTYWTTNAPHVVLGYPRADTKLPCYAITLGGEQTVQDYMGMGDHTWVDSLDANQGNAFYRRVRGNFVIYVYTEHPDICADLYRILRRIVNVGSSDLEPGAGYMITAGLEDVTLDGADLVPDQQYADSHMFVRRLTVSVEYNETWTDQDALWTALNGAGYPTGVGTSVSVHHEDSDGEVKPYSE